MQKSYPNFTSRKWCDCMGFHYPSYQIEVRSLLLCFGKHLHAELGTRLDLSTAFHPQTDDQSERTIQVLEDMLRACVIEFGGHWIASYP